MKIWVENFNLKSFSSLIFFFFPSHSEINMNKLLQIHKFKDVIKPKVLCKWEKRQKKERKGKKPRVNLKHDDVNPKDLHAGCW